MIGVIRKMIVKDGKEQPYVFITGPDNKQYFLHRSGMRDSLKWEELSGLVSAGGVKVQFDEMSSEKGPRAINCEIIS